MSQYLTRNRSVTLDCILVVYDVFASILEGLGDSEDYETLGSETETEHAISSRTESSNQLDDMSTLRDPSLIYARGPLQELQSGREMDFSPRPKTLHRGEKAAKEQSAIEETSFQNRIHHSEYSYHHKNLSLLSLLSRVIAVQFQVIEFGVVRHCFSIFQFLQV